MAITPRASTCGCASRCRRRYRERDAAARLDHRAHFLQVDLVHDPVPGRDHVDVLERGLGPVDEVEAVLVAAVLDGAVLLEGVRVEARGLDGQEWSTINWVGTTGLTLDGSPPARRWHHAGRPGPPARSARGCHGRPPAPGTREVQVALAMDQLLQRCGQVGGLATAHQLLGQHAGGVGELVPGAGLDRLDRLAGVEVIQRGAGQALAVLAVHGRGHCYLRSLSGTNFRSSGPV